MSFANDDLPRAVREAQSGNEEWADDFDLYDAEGYHKPNLGGGKSFTKKELQGLINKFPDNPDLFARTLLSYQNKPVILSPKQMEMIRANRECRFTVSIFSRQSGKSFGTSTDEVHDQVFSEPYSVRTIVFAPILDQTQIIFGNVKDFINQSEVITGFLEKKPTASVIKFKNGNQLTVRSASESTNIRGHSPTKIKIDESQDISDRKYYEDILPSGAATGAKVQETGTPKGRGHFYDTYIENQRMDQNVGRVITQTYLECPFMDLEYIEMMKRKLPRASFEQEFLLKWNFDSGAVWGWDLLGTIFSPEFVSLPEKRLDGVMYFSGIDIGKSPAETVVSTGKLMNPGIRDFTIEQVSLDRITHDSYTTIMDMIGDDLADYKVYLAMVDATGVGSPVFDILDKISSNVEPFVYTQDSKERMISQFTVMIENEEKVMQVDPKDSTKEIAINKPIPRIKLLHDEEQISQFEKFEKKKLHSGRFRYHAPPGGRDDIVNAVLLMAEAVVSHSSYGSKFRAGSDLSVVSMLNKKNGRNLNRNYDRSSFIKSFR